MESLKEYKTKRNLRKELDKYKTMYKDKSLELDQKNLLINRIIEDFTAKELQYQIKIFNLQQELDTKR